MCIDRSTTKSFHQGTHTGLSNQIIALVSPQTYKGGWNQEPKQT